MGDVQDTPVIPVTSTSNILGKTKRRTGDNCTGRLKDEQLKRQRTAVDGFFP